MRHLPWGLLVVQFPICSLFRSHYICKKEWWSSISDSHWKWGQNLTWNCNCKTLLKFQTDFLKPANNVFCDSIWRYWKRCVGALPASLPRMNGWSKESFWTHLTSCGPMELLHPRMGLKTSWCAFRPIFWSIFSLRKRPKEKISKQIWTYLGLPGTTI